MKFFIRTILIWICCSFQIAQAQSNGPEWAKKAIWYQVFVERFYNGNTSNDPRLIDIQGSWPHDKPQNWQLSNWTSNWYEQPAWEKETGHDFYYTVQMRRFGGDFEGVLKKIPHFIDLGINAIYFNPINDSPSLHKYDARNYRHMDRNFGSNPDLDNEIIQSENPADPSTWRWTTADSLFLKLVQELHKNQIKVIVDFSWNHTGVTFWAWDDILKQQERSNFATWYEIESFDNPQTAENEFNYKGWAGVAELPEFKKINRPTGKSHGAIKGNLTEDVKAHIFAVTKRWLDPNNDGDTSDGIDGFRLDVAEMVPLDFWTDYNAFVKDINPEAYLIGEVWWEKWPQKMFDPKPWLNDSIFHAVMNYRWFRETRSFFGNNSDSIQAYQFVSNLDSVNLSSDYAPYLMNTMATHDSERLASSFANRNHYKNKVNPRDDKLYYSGSITPADKRNLQLALIHQFTWIGAPHIWNGDEFLMTGADDPDNRKPIWWPEFQFDSEVYSTNQLFQLNEKRLFESDYTQTVSSDTLWTMFIKELIQLRKSNQTLSLGNVSNFKALSNAVVYYERELNNNDKFIIIINNSADSDYTLSSKDYKNYSIHSFKVFNSKSQFDKKTNNYILPPKDVIILKKFRS
ncbi:alpha-amylase [bacterium]|nr:MAG: alpha-amylase [bacterium]